MEPQKPGQRRIRHVSPELQEIAKQLRTKMTPAERRLWQHIRAGQLDGLRFRKQHPVETFVFDFFCPSHKLVVEVDGGIHESQAEHDAERDEYVQARGYRVLRLTNGEVNTDIAAVLEKIRQAALVLDEAEVEA